MHTKFIYLYILIISTLFCCKNRATIDLAFIKQNFIDTNNLLQKNQISTIEFEFINDTIWQNQTIQKSNNYLTSILKKCNEVDGLDINNETKTYTKALMLAEWTFGSFNTQFLGPVIGNADTCMLGINFLQTNIEKCYQAGNTNQLAIWCSERTALYTRLLDSCLNIKSKIISNAPTHVFPIVNIGSKWYIIDPYDPFILFNKNQTDLVDYYEIKDNNTTALRTKRTFGTSGELISKTFYTKLKNKQPNKLTCINNLISNYLIKNGLYLSKFIDSCTFENGTINGKIFPTNSLCNPFVIKPFKNTQPKTIKNSRVLKYYLGQNCKSNN